MRTVAALAAVLCLAAITLVAQGKQIPAPADVAKPPAKAETTPSGLASVVLTRGKGKTHPSATSQVTVHYTGWTTDGKMFDSSVGSKPATFG